jgi:hypothetical protein
MKINPLFKITLAFIPFILMVGQTFAQKGFTYKASFSEVKQSGFYKIVLSPEINAKCQPYLADLRIMESNKQVPYIIKQDQNQFAESSFIEFPIVNKTKEADKQTHITIENKTGKAVTDLLLVSTNMDAKRVVNISGSNDLKEWFIIKEGVCLDNYFSTLTEEQVQTISLPLVNYKYFQVTIIGKDILPFNIKRGGVYAENYIQGKYTAVPLPSIVQKDSNDKKSYVQIRFNEPYQIDKLVFEVDGPKFFKRYLSLYFGDFLSTKTPYSIFISSPATELFPLGWDSKEYLLVINNEDNQPLKVKTIKAYQLNQYLLTYLEAGKNYELYFGDSAMQSPNYDLAFFKDSIGKNPPELAINAIEAAKINQPVTTTSKGNFQKIILWSIIVSISILLLTFIYKMINDINRRAINNKD